MITCSSCDTTKPRTDFYGNPKRTARCKTCVAAYNASRKEVRYETHKRWVEENRERNRELCKRSSKKKRPARNALIDEAKNGPCVDCGIQYPLQAMDLDHLPGMQKKYKLSHYRRLGYSLETIQVEIAKCERVCACCHRTRTFTRRMATRTRSPAADTARYRTLQNWINDLKGHACSICSKSWQPHQLDFDHVDPQTKTAAVSDLIKKRASKFKILQEIAKCRPVCAICHRLRKS